MSTSAPPVAAVGTLTFSKDTTTTTTSLGEVFDSATIIQPDGSLTVYAVLKLADPGKINTVTAFVNVLVYSKIGNVPKVFEMRKTKDELTALVNLPLNDPSSDQVLRNSSNVVTHIRFRFDKVLLPVVIPGDSNPPVLPSEVIGINAYEQNNGTLVFASAGSNFACAYQTSAQQGVFIQIGQNPGKPRIEYQSPPLIGTLTTYLTLTAALRVYFPLQTGGVLLRTFNAYMMVESQSNNQVVAQILNRVITPSELFQGYADVDSAVLFYNSLADGDIVSFTASVDNINYKESVLADLIYTTATLKSPTPLMVNYRNAEILLPSTSTYSGSGDVPGVRFSFSADRSANWTYISVWARLSGNSTDTFKMAQMWSRNANNSDINNQLAANGVCEKTWNQKLITVAANSTTDSVGAVLPCMTAFEIYLVLSENADIATTNAALTSNDATTGALIIGNVKQSQSNASVITKVVTSIYRPLSQVATILSNISTATPPVLTLDSYYLGSDNNMPTSHLASYYSNTASANPQLRLTLRANDFTNNNAVVYDGSVTANAFNTKLITMSGAAVPSNNTFSLLSPTEWTSNYQFTIKNRLVMYLSTSNYNAIIATPAANLFITPSTQIIQIDTQKFLVYYEYSNIEPIRTRPTATTVLPVVYISSSQESRLWLSGSGTGASFGATQIVTFLNSVQNYNSFPYKWTQLDIQVSSNQDFLSVVTAATLTSAAALQAEILYLCNNPAFNMGNTIIAPQPGNIGLANTIGNFPSFTAGQQYYVRLRLRYMWAGASISGTTNTSTLDQYYDGPWYGSSATNSLFPVLMNPSSSPPLPPLSSLSLTRTRALKLVASAAQPEPVIWLTTGVSSSKLLFYSLRFQVVNALSNPVVFSAASPSYLEVLYNVNTSTAIAPFNVPSTPNFLDQFYGVIVTAVYKDVAGQLVVSPPLKSSDIFFENVPNFTSLEFKETPTTIQAIATIDLGLVDQVPVNTNSTNATIGNVLTGGLYVDAGMLLTVLIPAQDGTQEKFAHLMTWQPNSLNYQSPILTKIANADVYGLKTSFFVIANNNTGMAVAVLPRKTNANSNTWNIISTYN